MRSLIITLLFASTAFAEVNAVIEGPTTGNPGDLVVIDGSRSVGDGHQWIMPSNIQALACAPISGPGQVAFASGIAGTFTFTLIVADRTAAIDYAVHTVIIGGNPQPHPPDVPTPVPTPAPDLEKISYESASRLADATTARGLADSILAVELQIAGLCSRGQCPELKTAQSMMVVAIERRLSERIGASRNVDWLNGWRKPINTALARLTSMDLVKYQAAMRAIAAGLSRAN